MAGADAPEALGDEAAVVGVEFDDVGDGAQGDQGQQGVEPGLGGGADAAALAQLGAQGQQHVEHDADAGQVFAGEGAAGLVGVDDDGGGRQGGAGQVVVGDEHLQAGVQRGLHAFDAGDAVVHGEQQVGVALGHALCDGGGEAVAVGDAVGHEVVQVLCAQHAQPAQGGGAGGGAVAVVVGNDADALLALDGVGQQAGGFGGALQAGRAGGRQQAGEGVVDFFGLLHAAGGIQARQQRVPACSSAQAARGEGGRVCRCRLMGRFPGGRGGGGFRRGRFRFQ